MTPTENALLTAPITAVTVYPDRARVTRRGRVELQPGEQTVVVDQLPLSLRADSVRVAGAGAASVLGVDIGRRHQPRTTDEVAAELEEQLAQARAALDAIDDEDAVAAGRLEFLTGLARRATRTYAEALARGDADPAAVAGLADALASQQTAVHQARRGLRERRERAAEQVAAYVRGLEARRRQREPDHNAAGVRLSVAAAGMVELELSYVVDGAGWHSAYDVRLVGAELELTWYGLVTQHSGEDWPECDLRLSTARPSHAATVPELDPWFLDRRPPVVYAAAAPGRAMSFGGAGEGVPAPAMAKLALEAQDVPLRQEYATVEQGVTAATYRPARPVAVPADGSAHRATVAALSLPAERDYVTAPVLATEAHLRATVTNTSEHTLPAGTASVFHADSAEEGGAEVFVGSTALAVWAPGEEIELALGVDDRVRVERDLVRRSAGRAVIGSTRRQESEHRITVTNHTPRAARVTVLDQLPVSRDEAITVKETRIDPAPTERAELGLLRWTLGLEPGESAQVHVGVRVDVARGAELIGWRE